MTSASQPYRYRIQLKNTGQKSVRTTGFLLSLLALIIFLTRYFSGINSAWNLAATTLIFLLLLWNIYLFRHKKNMSFLPVLIIAGLGLILIPPFNFIGTLYLLLAALEKPVSKPPGIEFRDDYVYMSTGLTKRAYSWNDFNNILLKDGLLTLDFKNNLLLQRETMDAHEFSDRDFNDYCLMKLAK